VRGVTLGGSATVRPLPLCGLSLILGSPVSKDAIPPEADSRNPSHRRAEASDPLFEGVDPTAPGAPHEAGGLMSRQSEWQGTGDPAQAEVLPDHSGFKQHQRPHEKGEPGGTG